MAKLMGLMLNCYTYVFSPVVCSKMIIISLMMPYANLFPDCDQAILKSSWSYVTVISQAFAIELIHNYLFSASDLPFTLLIVGLVVCTRVLKYMNIYNYSIPSHRLSLLHRIYAVNFILVLYMRYVSFNYLIITFTVGLWGHYMVDIYGFVTPYNYKYEPVYVYMSLPYTLLMAQLVNTCTYCCF